MNFDFNINCQLIPSTVESLRLLFSNKAYSARTCQACPNVTCKQRFNAPNNLHTQLYNIYRYLSRFLFEGASREPSDPTIFRYEVNVNLYSELI